MIAPCSLDGWGQISSDGHRGRDVWINRNESLIMKSRGSANYNDTLSVEEEFNKNKEYYELGLPIAKPVRICTQNGENYMVEELLPGQSLRAQFVDLLRQSDNFIVLYKQTKGMYLELVRLLEKLDVVGDFKLANLFIKDEKLCVTDIAVPDDKHPAYSFSNSGLWEYQNRVIEGVCEISEEYREQVTSLVNSIGGAP